jgi:molybdopterin synthase sulfur carrier subunit
MRVAVRLFAQLREAAGVRECTYDVPAGSTVADVWRALVADHQPLETFTGSVSAAVNADFARLHAAVRDGDEVAFLPPVSGG